MHKQYGIRHSIGLCVCRALALILFLTCLASLSFSLWDRDGLSEEEKESLMAGSSFQLAVRLAHEISKEGNAYGGAENISTITYLTSSTRNMLGQFSTKKYLRVTRNVGKDVYFKFNRGFEEVEEQEYTDASTGISVTHQISEVIFSGAEIKYLQELLSQEDIETLVYQFKKNEVTSKESWNLLSKLLWIDDATRNYRNINFVRVGSVGTASNSVQQIYYRISFKNGDELYYMVYGKRVAVTDSHTYSYYSQNDKYFDTYDLEILFKEAGYAWP